MNVLELINALQGVPPTAVVEFDGWTNTGGEEMEVTRLLLEEYPDGPHVILQGP